MTPVICRALTILLSFMCIEVANAKPTKSPYAAKPINNSFVTGNRLKKYSKKKTVREVQRKAAQDRATEKSEKPLDLNAISTGEKTSCVALMGAGECQVFALTNKAREAKHLKPLKYLKSCYQSAQAQSIYMASMSNTGQSLSRSVNHDLFQERIKKFDVGGSRVTENVAGGHYKKPEELFNNWMNSAEHRSNILDPKVSSMALSMVEDKNGQQFWTQCFSNYK